MVAVLKRNVLILNSGWVAINVRNVVKSLTMVCKGTAKIVDSVTYQMYDWDQWMELRPEEDELKIRCIDFAIKIPEIIVLTQYSRVPRVGLVFNRRNVYTRDNYTCQYCGKQDATSNLSIDHVIPRSRPEGKSTFENCVVACIQCNRKKANKTPQEANMPLLSKPVKPKWAPSFHNGPMLSSWEKFLSEVYWNTKLG